MPLHLPVHSRQLKSDDQIQTLITLCMRTWSNVLIEFLCISVLFIADVDIASFFRCFHLFWRLLFCLFLCSCFVSYHLRVFCCLLCLCSKSCTLFRIVCVCAWIIWFTFAASAAAKQIKLFNLFDLSNWFRYNDKCHMPLAFWNHILMSELCVLLTTTRLHYHRCTYIVLCYLSCNWH